MVSKGVPTPTLPAPRKPPVSAWLNELEEKSAREFQRRTGIDLQTVISQIVEAGELQPGQRVIDVATSTAMMARHLAHVVSSKGKLIGVDSTKEKVELARLDAQSAGVGTKIEWRVAPANHLPFDPGTFDLVLCCLSFHQLPAEGFVKEACRLLKPEGILLIATELAPKASLSELRLRVRRSYYQLLGNSAEAEAHYYSSEEVTEMIRAAGFRQGVIRGLLPQRTKFARRFSLIKAVK